MLVGEVSNVFNSSSFLVFVFRGMSASVACKLHRVNADLLNLNFNFALLMVQQNERIKYVTVQWSGLVTRQLSERLYS